MQTDSTTICCRLCTPLVRVHSSNPSPSESTTSKNVEADQNFQYSISRNRSSIQLKISNQYLCENPQVVLSKDNVSETFSMHANPNQPSNTCLEQTTMEQCTSMEKGDFISFDYEMVDTVKVDDEELGAGDVKVCDPFPEKRADGDLLKGKGIVERLAWLLRNEAGIKSPQPDQTAVEPAVRPLKPQEEVFRVNLEAHELSSGYANFLMCSDSSSGLDVILEKSVGTTNFIQMPNNRTARTSTPTQTLKKPTFSNESQTNTDTFFSKFDNEPSKIEFLKRLTTTTSNTTIAKPISCVRFPVRLNQPPVQRLHQIPLPSRLDQHFEKLLSRKDSVKRVGLACIYSLVFAVMFTALAFPKMQCI